LSHYKMKAIKPSRKVRNFSFLFFSTRDDLVTIKLLRHHIVTDRPLIWIKEYLAEIGDFYVSAAKFVVGFNAHFTITARRGSDNVTYTAYLRRQYKSANPYCSVTNGEIFIDLLGKWDVSETIPYQAK
jgi:hypothetical protein